VTLQHLQKCPKNGILTRNQ